MRRRALLATLGTAAGIAGLAGCLRTDDRVRPADSIDGPVTVRWQADGVVTTRADAVRRTLHEAGLPRQVTVEITTSSMSLTAQDIVTRALRERRPEPTLATVSGSWLRRILPETPTWPLNRVGVDAHVDRWVGAVRRVPRFDDGVYGFPLHVRPATVSYRRDLLADAGYDPDGLNWADEPPTWRRFAEVVVDARETTGSRFSHTFQAARYRGLGCCTFAEALRSWGGAYFGGSPFGPVGGRPVTVAEERVVDALRMLRAFLAGPDADGANPDYPRLAPEAALGWSEEPSRKPFTEGRAVSHRNWPYALSLGIEAFGDDLGVAQLPYAVGDRRASYPDVGGSRPAATAEYAVVNPYAPAEAQAAAGRVLRAVGSDRFRLFALRTFDWLPPRPDLYGREAARSAVSFGRHLDTLRDAAERARAPPATPVWPRQRTAVAEHVHGVLVGDRRPATALTALRDALVEIESEGPGQE